MLVILVLLMSNIVIKASDFVFVGSYKTPFGDQEYNVILEYEGDTFLELEINVKGINDCKFTSWEIPGKNIKAFHDCLTDVLGHYKNTSTLYGNDNKQMQIAISANWPKLTISGIRQGESTDFETIELEEIAYISTYAYVSKGLTQLIVVTDGVSKNNMVMLESNMNFTKPSQFEELVKLTNPTFLQERINLKKELEQKSK